MSFWKHAVRLVAPLIVAGLAASSAAPAAPAQSRGCAGGYSYAGRLSATRAHGVGATLTALSTPEVSAGHVAAWVGVGGAGQGLNGTDAWIQIGLSAFPGSESRLYYEVARPGASPAYVELASHVRTGDRFRVAVLEMSGQPDHWRVWLNGQPVSQAVMLKGSSGRWRPMATAESWAGSGSACNRFEYRFEGVRVAAATGGSWRSFVGGHTFLDSGYRLVDRSRTTFVATTS
ncbi:MAG TPA: hypothetical protein VM049_02245 [Gaiellaceae bacterium]|nr:hypothetical protein [Gaiellaceae bacterium]